ncbi:hypothetical protein HA402_006973 [Bradysia odoriphaga]|nr:hypothetical protein HA402_006973 [Bradysia odoriphaga]
MNNLNLFLIGVLSLLTINIHPITCDDTFKDSVSNLHVNGHVMLNGRPCRINVISEPDDDGYINITGIDIFTSEIHTGSFLPNDVVDVPNVERENYTLLYINDDGNVVAIWESNGEEATFELPDGDLGDAIREAQDNGSTSTKLTVFSFAGEKKIFAAS